MVAWLLVGSAAEVERQEATRCLLARLLARIFVVLSFVCFYELLAGERAGGRMAKRTSERASNDDDESALAGWLAGGGGISFSHHHHN